MVEVSSHLEKKTKMATDSNRTDFRTMPLRVRPLGRTLYALCDIKFISLLSFR